MQYSHIGRRAQIGETMTWVVATIIIIAILGISIFIASAKFNKDKTPDLQSVSRTDTLASKSLFSYVLTKNSTGQTVYEQLNGYNNLNDFNGNLAGAIFNGFYGKTYAKKWVGVIYDTNFTGDKNLYFGEEPSLTREGNRVTTQLYYFLQDIQLTPTKNLEMVLFPK